MINEKEFIDNFAIELTNTTLFERKKIAKKYYEIIKRLEAENKEAQKRIQLLAEDNSWHCVQCTKALDNCKLLAENDKLKQALEDIKKYCNECNLKADYTACEVLKIINEVLK